MPMMPRQPHGRNVGYSALLNIHVLIGPVEDDDRLEEAARTAIVDPENDVVVRIVSFWERR
jgi:PIN domain nuclease of toxin-antitoxin system